MSLITHLHRSFIAEQPLTVYKEFILEKNQVMSPFSKTVMRTNAFLQGMPLLRSYHPTDIEITNGFVHAYVPDSIFGLEKYSNANILKATIPKGTEFYIDDEFDSICARELFISKEVVDNQHKTIASNPDLLLDYKRIAKYIFDAFIDKEKLSIGWLYLKDGSFVSPYHINYEDKKNSVGIVYYISPEDGKKHIVNIENYYLPYKELFPIIEDIRTGWKMPSYKEDISHLIEAIPIINLIIHCYFSKRYIIKDYYPAYCRKEEDKEITISSLLHSRLYSNRNLEENEALLLQIKKVL